MKAPRKIFEIGLGTNNVDVVSTMGTHGKPGASLRAFREFQKNCSIYGADFDKRILFKENRIQTFFVDQTNVKTFKNLQLKIGSNFDLMIDDGLHSPNANLNSLYFFLKNIKVGGYAVIEDININTEPIWNIVSQLIKFNFISAFIKTKTACMFIVKREK
jgi:cephalosporin hydroxylase